VKQDKALDVVVAGLAVVDIIGKPVDVSKLPKRGGLQLIDNITMTTGGNVSNVGGDLTKLGFRVGAITRVGEDTLGDVLLRQYSEYSIDTSGVIIDRSAQTSATIVSVDTSGERTFLHTRGCMAQFTVSDILNHLDMIGRATCLAFGYLGLLPQMQKDFPRLFQTVKEKTGVKILLDTAGQPPRLAKSQLKQMLRWVDYFFPSFEEAAALTGEKTPEAIVECLIEAGAANVVGVKLGAKGCYIADRTRAEYIQPRKVKKIVDTTGAGDAFVAGFLAGTLKGLDPFQAARIGNAVAASCVTAIGASTAIEHLDQYLTLVQNSLTD